MTAHTATAHTATAHTATAHAATAHTATAHAAGQQDAEPTWRTLRRGLAMSPELRPGLVGTIVLAVLATAGRVVVPVAIQQAIDRGVRAPGGPDLTVIGRIVAITCGVLVITMTC